MGQEHQHQAHESGFRPPVSGGSGENPRSVQCLLSKTRQFPRVSGVFFLFLSMILGRKKMPRVVGMVGARYNSKV